MKRRPKMPRFARTVSAAVMVLLMGVISPEPTVQAAASAGSGASAWEQTRRADGIRVFKRDVPGEDLVRFKGVGVVDAPIERVTSVLLDTNRLPEWVTSLKSGKVLKWIDAPTKFILYYWMEAPWPMRDREFVSRVTVTVDPQTHKTRVSYATSGHAVASSSRVRGKLGGSYYMLESIGDGQKTRVTGVAAVDPMGAVPDWVVNLYQRDWAYDVIMDLRKQSAKPDVKVLPELVPLYAGR